MEDLARWLRRPSVARWALVAVAALTAAAGAATASPAAALPDPCALLTRLHAEATLAPGKTVTVTLGKLAKGGSGQFESAYCREQVGTTTVSITLTHLQGGSGGTHVTSTSHPSGLGPGDELVIGTALGGGGPVDYITFHTAKAYVDLSAGGASPASLTALARQLYALVK